MAIATTFLLVVVRYQYFDINPQRPFHFRYALGGADKFN